MQQKDATKDATRTGKTALHFCAEEGNATCLNILLDTDRTVINAQEEEGYTALHLAVINGQKPAVKSLIKAGADLNCIDNERHSLVHWASGKYNGTKDKSME